MEESRPPATADKGVSVKKGLVALTASMQERLGYLKALAVGFTKKLTTKGEKEATEADMQTAKMQVDAANRAEGIKKSLADEIIMYL
ncbi:Unknown protein [Striga hermonthica]|uniref:Uncharacterized protein n=1 Tax=Striga hermonthica TaxID=68872 RepID=A0A9N7P2H4_STRHE|nr:Unknown protein [Striga hermonthica]